MGDDIAAQKENLPQIYGASEVSPDALIASDVIIGHPAKATLLERRSFAESSGARIGSRCILRSGTVIYEGAMLGVDVQTAHHVVIREGVQIGDGCVCGSGCVVRENAVLGRNVRLMESVVICEGAKLGDDIFVGPNVSFTAGRYMTGALESSGKLARSESAVMEGRFWEGPPVVVEDDVRIGANAVILAGVRLGRASIVAAGAVVSINVPPGSLIVGNPGRIMKAAEAKTEA